MRTRSTLLIGVTLCALLPACSRPFVLLPGGALEGATAPIPESWSFTSEVDTVQLETNPTAPYSVNIWVIGLDTKLYVHAGANRTTWVENIEADPNVRLRIGDSIYEFAATRVIEQEEFDRFSDAYDKKYGRRPRNENIGEVYLLRLGAPSPSAQRGVGTP